MTKRMRFLKIVILFIAVVPMCGYAKSNKFPDRSRNGHPNIVFIMADDLGYGDVGCYNPESKVPTPNLDSLAHKGMLFTDAHSPSTVCSPSRYSLMTGRNAFRTGFKGVFSGVSGPCLIEDSRLTLPAMLRNQGYTTACIGKWHIGMTFYDKDGKQLYEGQPGKPKRFSWKDALDQVKRADFSGPIPDGPVDRGFDHFFGTVCCPTTDWLYAFIEDDRIPVPPTKILDKSTLPDHVYSLDCRAGMIAPGYDLEEVDMVFLKKSVEFIENHAKKTPQKPFFLYHATQAVHLPSFPGRDFKGKTNAGPHGDFIFEFDYIVGKLLETLEKNGFGENTLVMISSDNGPETIAVKDMRETYNHDGARPWRGVKRDQWEGGHRVPFIAYWPGKIKPNSRTDQTVCLTDIMATCAAVVDQKLPNDAAEDSYSILPILLGEQDETIPIRQYTLHETGRHDLAIRKGHWKYLDHKGAGSGNYIEPSELWAMRDYILPERYPNAPGQLYNLKKDPGETKNLYYDYPKIVEELKARLEAFKQSGRSAPDVVMAPTSHTYLDYYQADPNGEPLAIGGFLPLEKVYAYNPVPEILSNEQQNHILGVQAQIWTEYIPTTTHAEYMAYPRACALAEVAWTPKDRMEYKRFYNRLITHLKRLECLDVNYRLLDAPKLAVGTWKSG